MRLRLTSTLFAAATALSLAAPRAAVAQPFTSLTFFGDSFTDTGNGDILAFAAFGTDFTPSPPYAVGVASDGPVWAQYFAAALGRPLDANPSLAPIPFTGRNYAIGTARTGLTGGFGAAPIGMQAQLGLYYDPATTDPTGLYALFGGSNDVFDAVAMGNPGLVGAAVDNLGAIATALYGMGARSFLIPNIPNVGLAPLARNTPAAPVLATLSAQFNMLLAEKLTALSAALPGSTFYGLRLDNLFSNILADAAMGGSVYGFTNVTDPCLPGYRTPTSSSCDVSVFADDEHPTTRVQALVAQAAYNRVVFGRDVPAVTATPEPATLALVGGGLVALGVVVRRRRRAA